MPSDGVPVVWHYKAGNWSQINPISVERAEFSKSFIWFDGMVEVFRGTDGAYRIDVCLDASIVETIVVPGLPDLLEVLQKLAPIAQTAMVNDVYDQMASMLAELERNAEPSVREE